MPAIKFVFLEFSVFHKVYYITFTKGIYVKKIILSLRPYIIQVYNITQD